LKYKEKTAAHRTDRDAIERSLLPSEPGTADADKTVQ